MTEPVEPCTIVCLTVQMGDWNPISVVEGSIKKNCHKCGIPVYLSLSGQKHLQNNPTASLLCITCTQKEIENDDDVKFGVVPGGIDEAIDHLKKDD